MIYKSAFLENNFWNLNCISGSAAIRRSSTWCCKFTTPISTWSLSLAMIQVKKTFSLYYFLLESILPNFVFLRFPILAAWVLVTNLKRCIYYEVAKLNKKTEKLCVYQEIKFGRIDTWSYKTQNCWCFIKNDFNYLVQTRKLIVVKYQEELSELCKRR